MKRIFKAILSAALLLLVAVLLFTFSSCSALGSGAEAVEDAGSTLSREFDEGGMAKESPSAAPAETTAANMDGADGFTSELYTEAGASDSGISQAVSAKLIKNATVEIEVDVDKFQEKFFQAASLAKQFGGYVSNSQSYSDADGRMTSGYISIRVAKDSFDAAIDRIKELGTVKSLSIGVQDVTQEYVDNESRLKNLEAQQDRLLDFMQQSMNVSDSIEVQRELSNVEGQIEVIKGRQKYLDNLISFSTIDIYISEPQPLIDTSTDSGFIGAVKRGARGALSVLKGITMVLIAISPLLIIAAIALIIIWQSIRARNRRRAAKAGTGQGSVVQTQK